MKNTHDKDASRRTVTRATAIAVAAGLVFTTAQVAQAQDPTEKATTPAVETTTSTPAVTPVESVTPVVSTATTAVAAAPAVAALYPSDYLAEPLKVIGINKDAKPSSGTGLVNWTSNEVKADDTGFITAPNNLVDRKVEIKLTAAKGLEGLFDRFKDNGEAFVTAQALVHKQFTADVKDAANQPGTDFARVPANDPTSKKIQDTLKVEVGEEGRELKISYTTPVNVGGFVAIETPGYFTNYTKDAKFDIKAEVSADVPAASALIPTSTESVEVKADKDYKAPSNGEPKATVKVYVNDANPAKPTGKTAKGTDSELTKDAKFEATGKDKVSVVATNNSEEVSLPDVTVVLPNGEVVRKDQEIKPGESITIEHETDLRKKDDNVKGFSLAKFMASQSLPTVGNEAPGSAEAEAPSEAAPAPGTPAPQPGENDQAASIQEQLNQLEYKTLTVKQGETGRVELAEKAPAGTTFELVEDQAFVTDLSTTNGNISVRPAGSDDAKEYRIKVRATNGEASKVLDAYVTVTEAPRPSSQAPSPGQSQASSASSAAATTTSKSKADEVNDVVEEIGTVLTGVLGGLAPILGIAGAVNQAGGGASTTGSSAVRVTPTNTTTRSTTTRSTNTGTSAGSRVASNASARTTNRTTTTRRAASTNSTRTTRTTRATTSSRTTSSRLANTGANSWSIAAIALLLIALAGMFLMISRRNREI